MMHLPSKSCRIQLETLEERSLPALLGPEPLYDPATILVRFRPESTAAAAVAGTALGEPLKLVPGLHVVELANGVSVESALAAYRADPAVVYAEPNGLLRVTRTPNDPMFNEQWGMQRIQAPQAWDANTGSGRVIVAVIDTGLDWFHPDIRDNVWRNANEIPDNLIDDDGNGYVDDVYGYDFINRDPEPFDDNAHGTHVSGIIGAMTDNGVGVAGLSWRVQIMTLKAFRANGTGTMSAAIQGLYYALTQGATISNNSYTCTITCAQQSFLEALAVARDLDHVFVAAAGNDGLDNDVRPQYPASFPLPNVVSVAMSDRDDSLHGLSNYGRTSVDLSAPGVDVVSTIAKFAYREMTGTSMATAHVTGVAALIRDLRPHWTYQQVIDQILTNVDPVPSQQGRTVTGGRLNARRAVPVCSSANPVVWTGGGGDTRWDNLRNWNSCALPGPNSDVVIDVPAGAVVTATGATVRSLTSTLHLAVPPGVSFNVTGGAQLQGGITLLAANSQVRVGSGVVSGYFSSAGSLQVQNGALRIAAPGESSGGITLAGPASLELAGEYLTLGGSVEGAGAVVFAGGFTWVTGRYEIAGTTRVNATGAVLFDSAARSGAFTNAGTVYVGYGGALTVTGDYTQTAGSTVMYGSLGVSAGRMIDLAGGALGGIGTLQGNLRNAARLDVGGEGYTGYLRLVGDYTQTPAGSLNVELGSWDLGEYDLFEVTGRATLVGTLNVALLSGFVAREDDVFPSLLYGSRTGAFQTMNLPNLSGNLFFDPVYYDTFFFLWIRQRA